VCLRATDDSHCDHQTYAKASRSETPYFFLHFASRWLSAEQHHQAVAAVTQNLKTLKTRGMSGSHSYAGVRSNTTLKLLSAPACRDKRSLACRSDGKRVAGWLVISTPDYLPEKMAKEARFQVGDLHYQALK
jgi:hypothetical protein